MADDETFDARTADEYVAFVAACRDRIDVEQADLDWYLRIVWTLGQVPAVTSAEQCGKYERRRAEILALKLGTRGADPAAYAAFLRTPDGAMALALHTRIEEWTERAGR